jgi:hypothetical protein
VETAANHLAVHADENAPPLEILGPNDSLESGAAILSLPHVPLLLVSSANTQVAPSVVGTITVYVIDLPIGVLPCHPENGEAVQIVPLLVYRDIQIPD